MQTSRSKPVILALDIGTSSVRAGLYDERGDLIPRTSAKRDHQFTSTADGGSEIDADVLLGHVVDATDEVLEKTSRLQGEIEAVATSCFWHSLVGIDEKGRSTTPVLGWPDRRSREYTAILKEQFDQDKIHDRTGAHFHSSFWPAKLLWLRTEFPNIFRRTASWISFGDYLFSQVIDPDAIPLVSVCEWIDDSQFLSYQPAYEFGGAPCLTSVSMASATGIFDTGACRWNKELLSFLNVAPVNLSHIVWRDHSFVLRRKYKMRWPRLKNAEWFPAIGDGAADHIGSAGVSEGRASLMIGTSGAMRVAYVGDPPKNVPSGLFCYRIDRKRVIIGGALSDGGNLYDRLKHNLDVPKNAEDEMRRRGADAHGLTFLPFLHGERGTGYNEDAKGSILGLNTTHDAIDILQAAMESAAYRFADILDQLKTVTQIKEIVASGGALRKSPVWTQIIADVLGRGLLVSDAAESSSRGAVLLALESLGKIENLDRLQFDHETLPFHPKCHEAYKKGRKRHESYYRSMTESLK